MPRKSKKNLAEDLHEAMTDPAVAPGDVPISADIPPPPDAPELPNRIQEHLDAEAAPQPPGQQFFAGLAPERHPAIDEQNSIWRGLIDEHKALTTRVKEAKVKTMAKMKDHGKESYKTADGWILTCKPEEKLKARRDDGDSVSGVKYSNEINPDDDDDATDADLDIDDAGEID